MADFSAQQFFTEAMAASPGATAAELPASGDPPITRQSATADAIPATERLVANPPDLVLPIISNFVPAVSSNILRTQSISFDVTDDLGVFSIIVVEAVADTGRVETVHDGVGFNAPFSGSRTVIANGFHYVFTRTGAGWPTAGLVIRIRAFDFEPNEASPQNYAFTVTNPLDPFEMVKYYRMRARDSVCVVQPAYVYWTVAGVPDLTGAECPPSALPCGTTPTLDLVDFAIALEWEEI